MRGFRPFAGHAPPAAAFFYSADRKARHPASHLASYAGLMPADAYAGFNGLYDARRKPAPITEAACWAHARHKFFDLARLDKTPIAMEAVKRMDALFAIEREINGISAHQRLKMRAERSRPLVNDLEAWLRGQRAKLSAKSEIAKAINYSLTLWPALTHFLDDGRLCLTNNAAERGLHGNAVAPRKLDLRRKLSLFHRFRAPPNSTPSRMSWSICASPGSQTASSKLSPSSMPIGKRTWTRIGQTP